MAVAASLRNRTDQAGTGMSFTQARLETEFGTDPWIAPVVVHPSGRLDQDRRLRRRGAAEARQCTSQAILPGFVKRSRGAGDGGSARSRGGE